MIKVNEKKKRNLEYLEIISTLQSPKAIKNEQDR